MYICIQLKWRCLQLVILTVPPTPGLNLDYYIFGRGVSLSVLEGRLRREMC